MFIFRLQTSNVKMCFFEFRLLSSPSLSTSLPDSSSATSLLSSPLLNSSLTHLPTSSTIASCSCAVMFTALFHAVSNLLQVRGNLFVSLISSSCSPLRSTYLTSMTVVNSNCMYQYGARPTISIAPAAITPDTPSATACKAYSSLVHLRHSNPLPHCPSFRLP